MDRRGFHGYDAGQVKRMPRNSTCTNNGLLPDLGSMHVEQGATELQCLFKCEVHHKEQYSQVSF